MKKRWVFPAPVPLDRINDLVQALNILPVTARILAQRGLEGQTARYFMNPVGLRLRHFSDLPGASAAGERIAKAIRQNEKMVIFGDYDVDGITASAALCEFIRQRGGLCNVHLPNRLIEGYGLNQAALEKAREEGHTLLITVDCGITAQAEIAYARENGMDVIVTDHHEPGTSIPDALIVVNPKVTGPEDLEVLAGVGVTMQVIRATAEALGEKDPGQLRKYLDLVALGTVADVVPLTGENRILTRAGLAVINRGTRIGIRALAKAAGLDKGPLSSVDLAFRLAPRINAAGRLGDAQAALELMMTTDADTAEQLAQFLNQQNTKRQGVELTVIGKADEAIQAWPELPGVIVVSGAEWPVGVVGLVASRLCEKYHRPCFVLSETNGKAKGSGRSIAGFSLHSALQASQDLLERWGGHDMAAGVTMDIAHIPAFRDRMQAEALRCLTEEDRQPILTIDAQIALAEVSERFITELKRFEPIGYKNARPMLALQKLRLCQLPRIVGERHIKLKVTDGQNHYLDVIGFGLGERAQEITLNNSIDIVGHASENVWNNTTSLQMEMKDFCLDSEEH